MVEKLITAGAEVGAANNEGRGLRRVSKFYEGQGVVLAEEVMMLLTRGPFACKTRSKIRKARKKLFRDAALKKY
jgi:hypothetical protein